MRQKLKRIIVLAFFLAVGALASGWFGGESSADHACCHVAAQEPGQDEPGNPSHEQPTRQCNHKPKGNQVQCRCRRSENCEEPGGAPREHIACKSYCFPTFCTCPAMPCP